MTDNMFSEKMPERPSQTSYPSLFQWHLSPRATALIALVAMLFAGFCVGVAAGRYSRPGFSMGWDHPPYDVPFGGGPDRGPVGRLPMDEPPGMGHDPRSGNLLQERQHMIAALGLSAEQANRIDSIVLPRLATFRIEQERMRAQVLARVDSMQRAIDSVLTPSQRVRAHQMRAQHDLPRPDGSPPYPMESDGLPPPDGP